MKALVTGAAGFVGANLVRHLLARSHDTIATVRPGGDRWRLDGLEADVARVELDLSDPEAVTRTVVTERPDVIFHLAAHGAYSWQRDLGRMLAVNVRATEALLEGAARVGATLINAGSSSEYGYQDHPPIESEPVRPNSHYAVTKVAATHLCQLAAAKGDVRASTLRLYSIYGPWEDPGRLMPVLVQRCRRGGWPPLVGPETARDFVWIDDACDAFLRAATCAALPEPGAVFNIASGAQTTLAELVSVATRVFDVREQPDWGTMAARAWDTSVWVGDPRSAAEHLGWRASTPLADGLARFAQWLAASEFGARYA
ncbi:MAG: NAD-dependent epimerase/dehydratase family protein [Solirubrobacteraceae bacterium]